MGSPRAYIVAAEVRSLALRTADAAKEIKNLTTASVTRVDHGSILVDQAGTTMSHIASSIRRVTDIMNEITVASSEQGDGVSQVSDAVNRVDQATRQNAVLVQHSAAAAEGLSQQAQHLIASVAVFELKSESVRICRDEHEPDEPCLTPASAY